MGGGGVASSPCDEDYNKVAGMWGDPDFFEMGTASDYLGRDLSAPSLNPQKACPEA